MSDETGWFKTIGGGVVSVILGVGALLGIGQQYVVGPMQDKLNAETKISDQQEQHLENDDREIRRLEIQVQRLEDKVGIADYRNNDDPPPKKKRP